MRNTFALPPMGPAERVILNQIQLWGALARERGRSDRTGEPFALLVLDCGRSVPPTGIINDLTIDHARRLRCTDEFGWVDHQRIGVLLPHTDGARAARVLQSIIDGGPARRIAGDWQIYGYHPLSSPTELQAIGNRVAIGVQRMESLFVRPLPTWKRVLDIIGASVGLVVSAPILLGAVVLIRLVSPGPAIFRQQRTGLGGERFTMFKLRTMKIDAEAQQEELRARNSVEGPAFKVTDDPRVIPFGRFLRTTSIDELPQLLNVLKGDMSLVGPRPLPCHESDRRLPWQRARLDVTPGMTGIWQVSGRSNVAIAPWARMDLEYARTRSLVRDLLLLVRTIPAVLLRRGSR